MIGCLVGNKRVKLSLENLIKDSRLPHAIIIEGDEGTGRHTLALETARAAVCTGENAPCNECRDCTLALHSNHPDIEIFVPEEKKKALTVEQIRKIKANSFVKAHRNGKKIFIIEKADLLSEVSQNALLKTIEEPPQDILFILICETSAKLLETVISRCVIFSLFPPERDEALEYIKAHSKKSEEEIIKALDATHNNIGKALKALGKKKSEKEELAERFLEALLQNENTVNLLLMLKPLEKDRVKAGEFIAELKLATSAKLRENIGFPPFAEILIGVYETVSEMEPLLITNVNLPLFFTTLIANLGG